MTYVATRGQEAGSVYGRGHVEGLATPWPIAEHLPGALQEDDFCVRMMAAFDEVMAPIFATLDCFDAYLDPNLAPGDFVEWLASWVGLEVDETWTIERRRRLIQDAAVLYRLRGTTAGLAAHIRLYAGVAPEVEESGACAWSQTADNPIPGSAQPTLVVRLRVDDDSNLRQSTISRIVAASRPAHIPYRVEVVVGGTTLEVPEEPVLGEAAADAPGAVDLPGSESIELAPQAPATAQDIDDDRAAEGPESSEPES